MNGFQPFVQERVMSKYEQDIDYNHSTSGGNSFCPVPSGYQFV